jgi:hypothetical protein
MNISDAIREGCKTTYQYFGGGFDGNNGYCAWGAAFVGLRGNDTWMEVVHNARQMKVDGCPICHITVNNSGMLLNDIAYVIFHLNDDHKMSREAIAEWVETVEKKIENEKAQEDTKQTEVRNPVVVTGECVIAR